MKFEADQDLKKILGNVIVSHLLMNKKMKVKTGPKKVAKHLFTLSEDEQLKQLVAAYGIKAWKVISMQMKDRTARQCRERWKNYLSPDVKNAQWTDEEDQFLLELVSKMGTQWAKIASSFESRTDTNVKNRFLLLQRSQNRMIRNSKNHSNTLSGQEQASSPEFIDAKSPYVAQQILMPVQNGFDIIGAGDNREVIIDFWDQSQWGYTDD